MDKTPIAIALERQIPEHIRGEYQLFVDFIKAYYEFLNETQKRDLEDIRSIENTLDEFISRFKKELSVLFPTNSLANERFILQRIREFYQARGSKESYQFLFRILFNKDSEIFYPSTQILRASDGKWIQEKSVFVKAGAGNLFNLSAKIVKIITNDKAINVFAPRVVFYREDIYEVFIDRAYVQDISIGDTIESVDGADYGTILPCPSKYTITSGGAGFSVGALYYLKTEKGDGSLVKVTKIGTGGSIKKVQIISFGLDYDSVFYAKISNKQATAVPYVHPIPGPYADGTTGFVDYGYISKQDYFYFDKNYTPSISNNQNVFYADGTYVGEIIGSFYTNATNSNVIDSSTAEIKIELGSVAIYPGYYSSSDGFVSDESYIQDGKYYQLFSYVIRVEQQIESYYNIVKELLHPAGMELYAEYNIKNEYLVSASPLLSFIRRQFLEQEFITDDEGTNSVYKNADDSLDGIIHNFLQDVAQLKSDTTSAISTNYFDDSKVIVSTDSTYTTSDYRYNDVNKNTSDTPILLDTITNKDSTQSKVDVTTIDSESSGRAWDISSITGGSFYQTTSASHSSVNDIKDIAPLYTDSQLQTDIFNRTVVYDRSVVPLVSLDPALSTDTYSAFTSYPKSDTSASVGGEWSWDGVQYILINPEIRIGTGYVRSPDLTLIGNVVAGSTTINLTFGTTEGVLNGSQLSKVSGSGAFDVGTIRVGLVIDAYSFDMNIPALTSGSITFTVIGDTTSLAQVLSTPLDSFPDGSIQGLTKFSLSGASWSDVLSSSVDSITTRGMTNAQADLSIQTDEFPDGSIDGLVKFSLSGASWRDTVTAPNDVITNRDMTSDKSDSFTPNDAFPNGSTQGLAKLSLSGASWSDVLDSPIDSLTTVQTLARTYTESINNTNTGTLYYNVYSQDVASDLTTVYSYEAEIYSVHTTRALS